MQRAEAGHDLLEVTSEEGLTAGEPGPAEAEVNAGTPDGDNIVGGEEVGLMWGRVRLWVAVGAPEVTALGQRYPEVVYAAAEGIGQAACRDHSSLSSARGTRSLR